MNKKEKEDWNFTFKDLKELYSILSSDEVINEFTKLSKFTYNKSYFNENDRIIIKLHWLESKSFNQIAKHLDVTTPYIRQRYQRIIRLMKINIRRSIKRLEYLSNVEKELENLKKENEALLKRFNSFSEEEKKIINLDYLKMRIYDFDLSTRTINALKCTDIDNVADLLTFKKSDFFKFKNFGKRSFIEIEDKILKPLGLELKE